MKTNPIIKLNETLKSLPRTNTLAGGLMKPIVYLTEGANQDQAEAILKGSGQENRLADLEKLDVTPTKKHMPQLARFLVDAKDFQRVTTVYQEYNDPASTLLHTEGGAQIRTIDLNKFKTIQELENFMHSRKNRQEDVNSIVVNGDPIYKDNKIQVWKGDSQKACVQYSEGYSFCIGYKDLGKNLFFGYRFQELTAFFVRFNDKSSAIVDGVFEDPWHLIVIHVGEGGNALLTGAPNGGMGYPETNTEKTTMDAILEQFPDLQTAFDKGVFEYDQFTDTEKEIREKVYDKNVTDDDFKNFGGDLKLAYINMGKEINDVKWKELTRTMILAYINSGMFDLTDYQKSTLKPADLKTYWNKIEIRASIKMKENQRMTVDETNYYFEKHRDEVLARNVAIIAKALEGKI